MTRITITVYCEDFSPVPVFVSLEVSPELTMGDLKMMALLEANVPYENRPACFFKDNNAIRDSETVQRLAILDDDIMVLVVGATRDLSTSSSENRTETADDIEQHRIRLLTDSVAVAQLSIQQPNLFGAIRHADEFRRVWKSLEKGEEEQEQMRSLYAQLLNADPLNPVTQNKIAEIIRQERVLENLQYAYEHSPEVFTRVTMLYIQTYVNGHPVKAFVDSGAQATIMSPACAERCGIMRLIDKRYSGVAKGVGTATILGRVHSAEMKVGDAVMTCAFTVMEGRDVELLFGLDMLKRHRACIDLRNNKLVLEMTEVPFLPESEIPVMFEDPKPVVRGGSSLAAQMPPVSAHNQPAQTRLVPIHEPSNPPPQPSDGPQIPHVRTITHDQIRQMATSRANQLGLTPEQLAQQLETIAGSSSLAVGPNGQIMRIGPTGRLVPGPPNMGTQQLERAGANGNGNGSGMGDSRMIDSGSTSMNNSPPGRSSATLEQFMAAAAAAANGLGSRAAGGAAGAIGGAPSRNAPLEYVPSPADIQSLMDMGIQKSLAELALRETDGIIDAAAALALEWTS